MNQMIHLSKNFISSSVYLFLILFGQGIYSQELVISEEDRMIKTYPFYDPDPIPNVTQGSKIYPYFKYEGYSPTGNNMPWKIIRLENDFIQVFIMPEAGGKLWGGIEKSTGNEFLYRNEVMKFRNIAMRGPWTSGGIELNFGIIGHSPSTATKVDYLIRNNEDGSVSCFVGNLDLTSRTNWRVEFRLSPDKAFFETNTLWYNPTELSQSYYNWMTAAAAAREDLEFFCPGYLYLEHSGDPKLWPIDAEGRKLSSYASNNFGPSKSYHVVGSLSDFFGGYFHDSDFGFGHWSSYEEMPGQKLWLWALSRSGGIWEDLLTDTDGQYIEFQAGRLLNQYSPGRSLNPIRQVGFFPYTTDLWTEIWFPFKDTGGMVEASPFGVLNVSEQENETIISINALQQLDDTLRVYAGKQVLYEEVLKMDPMDVKSIPINSLSHQDYEIIVGPKKLFYTSKQDSLQIKRPFYLDENIKLSERQHLINEGTDAMNFREYDKALLRFRQLLEIDPSDREALLSLSELHYRMGVYQRSQQYSSLALMQNTYDDRANFLAGIAFQKNSDLVNALESFGWAARSATYRSAAYTHMAEIYMVLKMYDKASAYAGKALDYNTYNISARSVEIIAQRLGGKSPENSINDLIAIDPLNHLARFEQYINAPNDVQKDHFTRHITNEFPEETFLELALFYSGLGRNREALEVLEIGPFTLKNELWKAYLTHEENADYAAELLNKTLSAPVDFVFPYRIESLEMLEWARSVQSSWKLDYYLALNYAGVGRLDEASNLLREIGDIPDSWIFYSAREKIIDNATYEEKQKDLLEALNLGSASWRPWVRLTQFFLDTHQPGQAVDMAKKGLRKFPDNYTLEFLYAKGLLHSGHYKQAIEILNKIHILPFEGAYESRKLYEEAHIHLALEHIQKKRYEPAIKVLQEALLWPENIGVGKPYDPDERKIRTLLAYCNNKLQANDRVQENVDYVVSYTESRLSDASPDHYLGLLTLRWRGEDQQAEKLLKRLNDMPEYEPEFKQWINDRYHNRSVQSPLTGSEDENYSLLIRIENLFGE